MGHDVSEQERQDRIDASIARQLRIAMETNARNAPLIAAARAWYDAMVSRKDDQIGRAECELWLACARQWREQE